MRLLIVRHADAGDRDEFAKTGKPDELRPLSEKGRKQMKNAAEGLRLLVPRPDLIVTSPYTRAAQTATIVADAYERVEQEQSATLEPDAAPSDFEEWLNEQDTVDTVIVVGHEPHVGELTTWLMTGTRESHVEFKKGGACLLEFEDRVKKGAGVMRWLMGPKELASASS